MQLIIIYGPLVRKKPLKMLSLLRGAMLGDGVPPHLFFFRCPLYFCHICIMKPSKCYTCMCQRHIFCIHTMHILKKIYLYIYSNVLVNQSEFRLCVEVGDHGAPFASVKCLHTALCHTHFRHLAHVASPTLSSSSSASFSIYLALQH